MTPNRVLFMCAKLSSGRELTVALVIITAWVWVKMSLLGYSSSACLPAAEPAYPPTGPSTLMPHALFVTGSHP